MGKSMNYNEQSMNRLLRIGAVAAAVSLLVASLGVAAAVPAEAQGEAVLAEELCATGIDQIDDEFDDVDQFVDVISGQYGYKYILCAKALGLSGGTGDGSTFGPQRTLTRGQMAAFLARLWRDIFQYACPTEPAHTFTDVADSFAAADIACIYALGITKGTSATTFSPQQTVKPSQITRFVARMLNQIYNVCNLAGSGGELASAADCLVRLNIAPDTAEATADYPALRAQMAVYLIGAWHYITKGKPPRPPTVFLVADAGTIDDGLLDITNDEAPSRIGSEIIRIPRHYGRGDLRVKLHVCTEPELVEQVSAEHVRSFVEHWNTNEAWFYEWQSSGLLTMRMEPGLIVTAREVSSQRPFKILLGDLPTGCAAAVSVEDSVLHHFVIFVHTTTDDLRSHDFGWARLGGILGVTFIVYDQWPSGSLERWPTYTISHELDHNVGVSHGSDISALSAANRYYVSEQDSLPAGQTEPSLLGSMSGYQRTISYRLSEETDVAGSVFLCYQLDNLGWPRGAGNPGCRRAPPGEPSDITTSLNNQNRIVVTWKPPMSRVDTLVNTEPMLMNTEPITGYRIRVYTSEPNKYDLVNEYSVPATSRQFTLPQQPPGYYEIGIVATTAVGDSSESRDRIRQGASGLKAVRRLYESGVEINGIRNPIVFDISWSEAPDPYNDSYRVYGFEGSDEYWVSGRTVSSREVQTTSLTLSEADFELVDGKIYRITVEACQEGSSCEPHGQVTLAAFRNAPLSIKVVDPARLVYSASWSPLEGAVSYQLIVSGCADNDEPCNSPDPFSPVFGVFDITSATTEFGPLGFERGNRYWIQVLGCLPGDVQPFGCRLWTETALNIP